MIAGGQGGFGGGGGNGNFGGFGGGLGSFGGGGGLGAGGDIFVQAGGELTIVGAGTSANGFVDGGTATGTFAGVAGFDGAELGSSIFLQGDQVLTYAPGAGLTQVVRGTIADMAGYADPNGIGYLGTGRIDLNGPGTLVLSGNNTFIGGVRVNGGTLRLEAPTAAGTGGVTFTSSGTETLEVTSGALTSTAFNYTISGFGGGDFIRLIGFTGDAASVSGNQIIVTSGGNTVATFIATGIAAGTDLVVYSDGDGGSFVTIPVPLVGNADSYNMGEDDVLVTGAAQGVLSNDSGAPRIAALVDGPAHGDLVLAADGSFTYTPDANYFGTDGFTYTLSNGLTTTDPINVTLNVYFANDAPTGSATAVLADGVAGQGYDITLTQLIEGFSDIDGLALSTGASYFVVSSGGTAAATAGNIITITMPAGFSGLVEFEYSVIDFLGGSIQATNSFTLVGDVNSPPVGVADGYSVNEDLTLTVALVAEGVLGNDLDVDADALTATLVDDVDYGTLSLNADGTFTYTPDGDYNGPDSFTYTVSDGTAATGPITVSLTVDPVSDAPVAVDDGGFVTPYETWLEIFEAELLANDSDPDSPALHISSVGGLVGGSAGISGGSVLFIPTAGFSGAASFSYTVSDGIGTSNTAIVTLTVGDPPVNTPPVAAPDSYTLDEDSTLTITLAADGVLGNDSDADGDPLSATLASDAAHGTLALNADGTFSYTPDVNYAGPDSFTYTLGDGTDLTGPVTVSLTVTPVNDAPTGAATAILPLGTQGQPYAISLASLLTGFSDADGDTLSVDQASISVAGGSVGIGGGTLTITMAAGASGAFALDYTVIDGSGGSIAASLAFNLQPLKPVSTSAGSGDDNLVGAPNARNTIAGNKGNDTITGGNGNDTLLGNAGSDTLLGGNGHDTLRGGGQNDVLDGGDGEDRLYGDLGSDKLHGGADADVFAFAKNFGLDVITDFAVGEDLIEFSVKVFASFAQLQAGWSQDGTDVIINAGNGHVLRIENILLADLTAGNFIFA